MAKKSKRFIKSNSSNSGGKSFGKNKHYRKPQNVKRLQNAAASQQIGKPEPEVPTNPFEIRTNKRKHDVMGRLSKHEKGLPGVSRAKATEKRKETLLHEYKMRNKSNVVLDRRIGEKNKNMPEEDKLVRRAAVEKTRQYKKKSIFSLGDDDESFTHKGKPLVNIDRYEDPRDMSDSEDELLSEAFVGDANFSGFLRVKKPGESEEEDDPGFDEDGKPKQKKTRDEIIAELILASKKRKFEKAKETDENYEKIQELDAEFKTVEFKDLLNQLQAPKSVKKSYLSNITSTDELLAAIRGEDGETKSSSSSSVEPQSSKGTNVVTDGGQQSLNKISNGTASSTSAVVALEQKLKGSNKRIKEPSKDETDYDRLVRELQFESKKARPADLPKTEAQQVEDDQETLKETLESCSDLSDELKSKLEETLQVVFQTKGGDKTKLPDVLSKLIGFFLEQVDYSQSDTTNTNSKGNVNDRGNNKKVTSKVSIFSKSFKALSTIILQQMNGLLVANSVGCTKRFLEHVIQVQEEFLKKKNRPLSAKSIALLHLCPKLFPIEDHRHWVLSPATTFLLQAINQAKLLTIQSAFRILHLTCILYEFVETSKRYCPEAIGFLWSVLLCFCPHSTNNTNLMVPNVRKAQNYFRLEDPFNNRDTSKLDDIVTDDSDSDEEKRGSDSVPSPLKFEFLSLTLDLLRKYTNLYAYLPSSVEIFSPVQKTLEELLNCRPWSETIKTKIVELMKIISNLKGEKQFLRIAAVKPKPLKLYEPQIDEDFDGVRRRKKLPRHLQEQARLTHKVKKEFKSAVREIKKDNAFLARQELREQMEADSERKRKVKQLLGSLANQEGDYQKIKRAKK